jgi:hypothetical protein
MMPGQVADMNIDGQPAPGQQFAAIDFTSVNQQLLGALQYVGETRGFMIEHGVASTEIDQLEAAIQAAIKQARTLEIDHAEELTNIPDGEGYSYQGLLREQDETGFDEMERLYTTASDLFDRYFQKHITLAVPQGTTV